MVGGLRWACAGTQIVIGRILLERLLRGCELWVMVNEAWVRGVALLYGDCVS